MEEKLDIEGRLRIYFPILFELLGDNKLDWKTITKVFQKKLNEWHRKHELTGSDIRIEASFYNIITASIQGNQQARNHLDFIQKLFETLLKRLNDSERKLILSALFGLLTNMNKMYRNFLGELCVLNNVKGNTNFILNAVEVPVVPTLPAGKKIDFDFINPETKNHLLVEIVNVHLNNVNEWNDEKVHQLLHQKIQGKLNSTGIKKNDTFQLIPVFWGSFDELKRINEFYKTTSIKFQNTSDPVCYASFSTASEKRKVFWFGTIDSIINKSLNY